MMNQSIHGDAGHVTAAGRDHIEIETNDTHHHHHPNNNRQNEFPLGDVEIRRLGFKVTGLNATFAIAGTVYLGSIALNGVLSLVQAYCEQVLFKVDHGSYIIHVIAKDAQSKKVLLEQVTSKALEKKLESMFDKKVEVHLVEVGAVIATEEEFAQLKKHMEKKLEKIQFKIDNNCKGTIEDFCCTMPIFQNKSRFLMHEVTSDTEDDIIECLKNNLEFVELTAHEKHNAKFKQQGFLVEHPDFSKFSETFHSHPGLQEKVVEVIDTVEELVKQRYVVIHQLDAEKLLEFNPILFTGNFEMALRKLAKFAKTFMFEKKFEITKSLLVWMIKLCNNIMDENRIRRLLFIFFKLIKVFVDFVSKCGQHLRGKDFARELCDETERCAKTKLEGDLLSIMIRYIVFVEEDRYDLSYRKFLLCFIIEMTAKHTGTKNGFKRLHYYLKLLLLMTRNCNFEEWRFLRYDDEIRNLLEVAERLVEISHSRCVRMVAEILEILRSKFQLSDVPHCITHMHQILLHSFNTILHDILESRKKSQCENNSICGLLFTIYKLLLLYNDQSAKPLPVTELSSCVLRLCYYHTHDNGKLPHELSVPEIFDSGSKLLKQVTEKNKAANKFMIYENNLSKFDKVSDTSDYFTQIAFPRRNVDRHRSLSIRSRRQKISEMSSVIYNSDHASGTGTVSSGYGSEQGTMSSRYGSGQGTRSSCYLSGQGTVPSGYRSKQGTVSSGYGSGRSTMHSGYGSRQDRSTRSSDYGSQQSAVSSLPPPPPLSLMRRLRIAIRRRFSVQHTSPPSSPPVTKK